ncbi:uncharacterized protein LY89DRAFT_658493 [Mollisia scopiformis]|uniref:Uncharacterized protein n=1 Tax=Mollisia scopiformis TaxID=149040 RepID=A0A132B8S0_MOLSC|nr:uncharacterized protein LY89DRAFT_658493 [Mollisia scopiformis]KUJ08795.1 hypothetical protein LY89DRAFT_658493 [Mollisia scopiformis]
MARYVNNLGSAPEEGIIHKLIHVPGLMFNTIISTMVLIGLETNWSISGSWKIYHFITTSPTTTQQVVTVTAGLLATIHANAITKLINHATRITLLKQPTSLHRLKWWYTLSTISLDLSVRWAEKPVVLGSWLALSHGLSFLWAGAIAPVPAMINDMQSSITLPQYTGQSSRYWAQNGFYPNQFNASLIDPKGTFTYLPTWDRLGYLIVDGSSATSTDGQTQVHSKNDNSNYTYVGRSYGVGSSVGLSDEALQNTTLKYQYTENGYHAAVDCIYNASSQLRLLLAQPGCGGLIVGGIGGDQDIVAAGWWASTESGLQFDGLPNPNLYIGKTRPVLSQSYTALTAGSGNPNLNNVQCSISMVPTAFIVNVDTHNRKLSVAPQNNSNMEDIEPTGFIADSAAAVLAIMASSDTSFKTSVIGSILIRNVNNKILQQGLSDQSQLQDVATLQGIAESIETLIDDSLLATASAQLMIAKDVYTVTPSVWRNGLWIGEKSVVIALVLVNAFIIALFIEEALRTRIWRALPKFDYSKVENIMVATSLGGSALGDAVLSKSSWVGGDLTEAAEDVRVMVSYADHVQLAMAGEETDEQRSEDRIELIPRKDLKGYRTGGRGDDE